jgi:hypothetical protein
MPTSITSSGITFDDATTLTTGVLTAANIASGAVTPAKLSQPLTLATAVATTSGTAIDFTGIPSWVKRITVIVSGISASGTSPHLIRAGTSSGFVTSGYASGASVQGGTNIVNSANSSSGFIFSPTPAAISVGSGIILLVNVASNTWVFSSTIGFTDSAYSATAGGTIALGGTLDRIRLTTVNGTDTFDAGSVNIIYEG